jgi:methyltransferase (TIGR00027 family)
MSILFYMQAYKPSRTAEYMALFRAVETSEPANRRLFEDSYAVPLLAGRLRALAQFAYLPVFGGVVRAFLDFGWPGTRSSGVVRTRWIDDLVRESLRSGIKQFVLLGAGFDSRPYRLVEAASIQTFELDHPATQKAKRERLATRLKTLPANVLFVETDFEKDNLHSKLKDAGFDQNKPALVLWEGVVSYLSEPAIDTNLVLLRNLLAPGSRLILTYVHQGVLDGSVDFRTARRWRWWVRRGGEPFISGFDPGTLANKVAGYGFDLQSDLSTADAAEQYRASNGRRESGSEFYRVACMVRTGA